ncbi:MAG: gliding motility-associated C-terminal domain-containing protein [Fulvivirga sp.]|uniref:gliding motility-associated C-terminal domain-containing protein n=1 Tax=Fulvivirga sp. TaxID=1931237 RepID=UPI0032EB6C60
MRVHSHYILFFLFTFFSKGLIAQCTFPYTSNSGTFTVSQIKGCAPLQVNICINSSAPSTCTGGESCDFLYGDGSDEGADQFENTYTEPGNYRLEIIYPNPAPSDFIDIVVTDKTAPEFEVYACGGNTVRVDITDTQYDNYTISWGDGTDVTIPINTADQEHTYANTNTRTITVQGIDNNALDNCASASTSFTPLTSLPAPTITRLSVLNNSQAQLSLSLSDNIFYRLEVQVNGTGNFNFIKAIEPTSTEEIIDNLDLDNNFYCFRIGAFDPCTSAVTYSNSICSINLSLLVNDGFNSLLWDTSDPTSTFSIARKVIDDSGSSTTNPYLQLSPQARLADDANLNCNIEYCYFIEADFNGGTSISNEVCGIAQSTLPPDSVTDMSISVTDAGIQLAWGPATQAIGNYQVRSSNSSIDNVDEASYLDSRNVGVEASSCYIIVSEDECGNSNQSKEFCSIFLSGSIAPDNTITLDWNDYNGFADSVDFYQINKFYNLAPAGTFNSNTSDFIETDANPNEQVINYQVTAIPRNSNLSPAVSNIITIIKLNNIYYPTAFTPDGNGTNETFSVKGQFIIDYQLQIFNRWGEMIFTTNNPDNGWDGTYNSSPQHEGTYVFNLKATDLAGQEIERSGSFLLLRR